jgi:hypothetical protein
MLQALFGRRPRTVIEAPPEDAEWRWVRPKTNQRPVRAWQAESERTVRTAGGRLKARAHDDYIVQYDAGHRAVVRGDIFARTYEPLGGGLYRKRSDYAVRCFTLDRPALVHTFEGMQAAETGDCLMLGTAGEMWTMSAEELAAKYEPA